MVLKRDGAIAILGLIGLVMLVSFLVLPGTMTEDPISILVRLFALYGYLFLSVATLTTPFLREVTLAFGKPFLRVHHAFAAIGVVLITLHPIFFAVQQVSLAVFIPSFKSWSSFWMLAGRPALIIIYIAVFAAFLRTKALKYWRSFHALMYVALLFGIVHGHLMSDDFQNPLIAVIFDVLFLLSLGGFALKRYLTYQNRRRLAASLT